MDFLLGKKSSSSSKSKKQKSLKELALKPTPISNDRKPDDIKELEEDRIALLALFQFFDQDQNGYLQRHQLKHLMDTLGNNFTDEEFKSLERNAGEHGKFHFDK